MRSGLPSVRVTLILRLSRLRKPMMSPGQTETPRSRSIAIQSERTRRRPPRPLPRVRFC